MPKHTLILLTLLISATGTAAIGTTPCRADSPMTYDLVIYGGTSAGIAAAVQAKRMGASVVVIEPTSRIGGLTTGGLGQTDIGNKAAIGGISRNSINASVAIIRKKPIGNGKTHQPTAAEDKAAPIKTKTPCGRSSHQQPSRSCANWSRSMTFKSC